MKITSKRYGLVVRLLFLTSTAFVDTKCEGGENPRPPYRKFYNENL